MSVNAPDWLIARPIAHRGLHDASVGRIENSLSAAKAAVAGNFAIECDVQLSADGEAMVFHDEMLDRLTVETGAVAARMASALRATRLRGTGDCVPRFIDMLDVIDRAVPLICEIKSGFDGDFRLTERAAELAAGYSGPLAFKSFDPAVIAHLRSRACARPLGIVAEASYADPYWNFLDADQKRDCSAFLHYADTQPDFLSFAVYDLPHPTPTLMRLALRLPVMTWTVRTQGDRRAAAAWADQIVFEVETEG